MNDFEIKNGILKKYNGNAKNTIIPNDVKRIISTAFDNPKVITSLTIPFEVKIPSNFLKKFSNLKDLTIGMNILARALPKNIESITFLDTVTDIMPCTLMNFKKLKRVALPNTINKIPFDMFYGCKSLVSVNIPNTVTEIQECAFYDCISLKSITIPDSVKTIEDCAFYGCENLIDIEFPNYKDCNIHKYAFELTPYEEKFF